MTQGYSSRLRKRSPETIELRIRSLLSVLIAALAGVTLPVGTELPVRLTSQVTSNAHSGEPVTAELLAPVYVGSRAALPPGTRLAGNVADVVPYGAAKDGSPEQPASLRLLFTRLSDTTGHSQEIYCVLEAVDNARETVDSSGLITGILSSQTYEAQIDRGISKLESRSQQFAQILNSIKGAFLKDVDASIDYKPGTDLTLRLTRALDWTGAVGNPDPVAAVSPAGTLLSMVAAEPVRTVAQSPPNPSDIINLMFIGSQAAIEGAFRQAGWFPAEALSQASKMETARAIIENRGYNEAPMSILLINGQPPELTFQKQNNTFAKRHHIRIWPRPDTFNGKPVWLAAATHDISISFSPVSKTFTHAIDSNIDAERAKVVADLLYTKRVQGISLVQRSSVPQNVTNATGDKLITDGRIAVLELQ